jgi:hypothetical protein
MTLGNRVSNLFIKVLPGKAADVVLACHLLMLDVGMVLTEELCGVLSSSHH